jgi:hypothetical protein
MAAIDSIGVGNITLYQVDTDPTISGVSANIGDIAILFDGSNPGMWQKIGATDTDWNFFLLNKSNTLLTFDGYTTDSSASIDTAWVDMPINIERLKDTIYTHAANSAEITVSESTRYEVVARVSLDEKTGNNRTEGEMRVLADQGSGFVEVPGTRGYMYSRNDGQGANTATVKFVNDYSAGTVFKVQARRSSGTSTLEFISEGCSLTISEYIGQKGEKGNTGAGSSVSVSDNGIPVAGVPFDTINTVGEGIYAEDAGGGQVNIFTKTNAMAVGTDIGSASNAADQNFQIDLSNYGFKIGDIVRVGNTYVRGDLSAADELLSVGIGSTAAPKTDLAATAVGFGDDAVFRPDGSMIDQTYTVVDIGSGVPGLQVYVSPSAAVNFDAGLPNGWWWQLKLDILVV